jgi:hypothetical protein
MSNYRPKTLKENPDPFSKEFHLQTLAKKKGFKSYSDYSDFIAKQKGFSSTEEYNSAILNKHGFKSQVDYKEHLAMLRGFTSAGEYDKQMGVQRQKRERNRRFAEWMNSSLSLLHKDRAWLISKTGLSRQMVSLYCRGLTIPRDNMLSKIRRVFEEYSNPSVKLPDPPES